jgi:uncharacterized protein (TIGR00369 family)
MPAKIEQYGILPIRSAPFPKPNGAPAARQLLNRQVVELTMQATPPPDPDVAQRVAASFQQQTIMSTIGASLLSVAPGAVEIGLPFRADLCQQDGFLHAGIVTTIVDSACGYAAYTYMPNAARVLSVEFKVNFLTPAVGDRLVARGKVVRAGRTITVCAGEVVAYTGEAKRIVALMQATMMCVLPRA